MAFGGLFACGFLALVAFGAAETEGAFAGWARRQQSPLAWLALAFVVWPLLGLAALAGECVFGILRGEVPIRRKALQSRRTAGRGQKPSGE
jgi:integral membrane sensor domain MASE1